MTSPSNNQWILKARPTPGDANLDPSTVFSKQCSQTLPQLDSTSTTACLQDGQVLAQVLSISIDHASLTWISSEHNDTCNVGDVVPAVGIAQVIQSKHKHFHAGEIVHGLVGWQQYVIFNPHGNDDDNKDKNKTGRLHKPPDNVSLQTLICMPSALTAYFGMYDKAKIRQGDTVLVSDAAGAVGFLAGQVAKILGAKLVVGIVDSPSQKQWLLASTSRFDVVIDQSTESLDERLPQVFPNHTGINVYFDSVGVGPLLDTVILHLAHRARVIVCGAASFQYLNSKRPYQLHNFMTLVIKSATVYGFMLDDYRGQFMQGIVTLCLWIKFNRLVLKMEQHDGFDCLPMTLARLANDPTVTGQQVVKMADRPLPVHTDWWFKAFIRALTAVAFVGMMDKLVTTVEDRAENVAIDKLSHEIQTETVKHKSKQKNVKLV